MSVGASLLTKIRYGIRRNTSTLVDSELTDIIEECRADMIRLGVTSAKANSETDYLVIGAVRSFARWKFGLSNEDAEANKEDYLKQVDELRRSRDYAFYTVTFTVKNGSAVALADAYIEFNGETQQTNTSGIATFYYVESGVNQKYIVWLDGYTSVDAYLDIAADTSVNVTLS